MAACAAGHSPARSPGPGTGSRSPAYLGGSDKFDQAVADFAESYADQTDRDHTALADAVASGRAQARVGV
jgi:hypothetical protein